MKIRWLSLLLIALLVGSSCSRDPNVAKKKYLDGGNRYFEKSKYNEARIMYLSALKKDIRYGEAYYRLGLTYMKLNNPVSAERALRRAFELLPRGGRELADTTGKLSDIYLIAYMTDPRRTKSYEASFKDFVGRLPKNSFDRLRLEGYLAWRNKDIDGALADFKAAFDLRPMDPNLTLAYAEVMIGKDQFDQAEALAKNLIAKNKSFGAAYDMLYSQYLRRNRPADAEQMRKQKADNNPTLIEYRLQLAAHYFLSNRRDEGGRVVDAIVADKKTFPRAFERAGDFYMTFREFDKAISYYREGTKGTKEERLNSQRKIADVLMLQGKRDQALRLIDTEILKENPKDPVGLALRATLWLEAGNRSQLQQAVSELETAVGKLPQNAVVRYNLGRAYWAKGDVDLARAQFRAASDIQPDYLPPRMALAQIQISRSEFAAALQTADEILAMSPANQPAGLVRSLALQGMGKLDEARLQLQNIIKVNPGAAEAKFRLGILEINSKNYPAAERIFRECLDSTKGDVVCVVGLAEVYSAQKQFDKAAQVLSVEQQKNPDRRELRMALANTSVLAGKYEQAATYFKQLIAKEPESSDLLLRLAETYRRMGNVPLAIENFRKVKQLSPNTPEAAVWLALLLHQTGLEAEAKVEYERILRLQPDNAVALNNLAYVMAEQGGDLDVALTYAQRAKQKLPLSLQVADTLGWIYLKKKLTPNAIEIYSDLVAKKPDVSTYRFHLGLALYQKGDKLQAKKELEGALRSSPSPDEAGKIKETLAKL